MERLALLIRGINVGKGNALPMADLRSMLEKCGAIDVKTYVQSGNAIFSTNKSVGAFARAIETALGDYMGRPIATTIRTSSEMNAIVKANPFRARAINQTYSCVTFLSNEPTKAEMASFIATDFGEEAFKLRGKEIYTWHPNGQGKSPLAVALGKLRLRGAVTTRNWRTVLAIAEMINAD